MTARSLARRTGTTTAALAVAVLAALPLAGVASASTPAETTPVSDRNQYNCPDVSQAQAQAMLDADPSDPNHFDRDHDGKACESDRDLAGAASTGDSSGDESVAPAGTDQVHEVPSGAVEAGDGSDGGPGVDPAMFLLVGAGAVVAAGAGTAVWSGRRSGRAGRA